MSPSQPDPAGVVFWLQVPPASARSLSELSLAAAARCAFLHGGEPEDWLVQGDWDAVHPFPCAGVRREELPQGKWQPRWLAWRAQVRGDGWHAAATCGRVVLWHQARGRVNAIAPLAVAPGTDAREALVQRMQVEVVNQPSLQRGRVQLHGMAEAAQARWSWVRGAAAAITATGLAAAAAIAWHAWETTGQLAATRLELQAAQRRAATPPKTAAGQVSAAERQAWSRIAHQLNTPWSALLDALETGTPEPVALVSVEPDPRHAAVRVQAEARSLDVLLAYAQRLAAVPPFEAVSLVKHETNEQDPNKPVRLLIDLRLKSGEPAR